jgi:hypothetical protein
MVELYKDNPFVQNTEVNITIIQKKGVGGFKNDRRE